MARIAFVNEDLFFRLGVASIISVLKQNNHKCEIFLEKGEKSFLKAVKDFSPDIIAISCTSGEHNWMIKTAKALKEKLNMPILLGGPHPTFFSEIINEPVIDMICIGEGEYATLELLSKLDKQKNITKIKNLWVKKDNKIYKNPVRDLVDLDSLPFVDRDCYDKYKSMKEDPVLHVYTSKGCPFNCTYCYNKHSKELYKGKGSYIRQRNPKKVIEEIKYLIKRYPKSNVVRFHDDLFIYNKKWLYSFLELYNKNIKIPFICSVRADLLTDEIVKKLKESGCDRVSIGVECGDEEIRKNLLNKLITDKQMLDAASFCHKHGLRMTTYNMLGLPGETIEDAIKTIRLNYKMNPELAWASIFQPYPGTDLAEYAIKRGLINKDFSVKSMTPFMHNSSVLKQKDIKKLCNLHMFFWFAVKHPNLIPIIKQIIKLPQNRFNYFFFNIPTLKRRVKYSNFGFFGNLNLVLKRVWRNLVLGDFALEDK